MLVKETILLYSLNLINEVIDIVYITSILNNMNLIEVSDNDLLI